MYRHPKYPPVLVHWCDDFFWIATETERQKDRETETDRQTGRTDYDRDRETGRQGDRETETDRQTDRQTQTDRKRETGTNGRLVTRDHTVVGRHTDTFNENILQGGSSFRTCWSDGWCLTVTPVNWELCHDVVDRRTHGWIFNSKQRILVSACITNTLTSASFQWKNDVESACCNSR